MINSFRSFIRKGPQQAPTDNSYHRSGQLFHFPQRQAAAGTSRPVANQESTTQSQSQPWPRNLASKTNDVAKKLINRVLPKKRVELSKQSSPPNTAETSQTIPFEAHTLSDSRSSSASSSPPPSPLDRFDQTLNEAKAKGYRVSSFNALAERLGRGDFEREAREETAAFLAEFEQELDDCISNDQIHNCLQKFAKEYYRIGNNNATINDQSVNTFLENAQINPLNDSVNNNRIRARQFCLLKGMIQKDLLKAKQEKSLDAIQACVASILPGDLKAYRELVTHIEEALEEANALDCSNERKELAHKMALKHWQLASKATITQQDREAAKNALLKEVSKNEITDDAIFLKAFEEKNKLFGKESGIVEGSLYLSYKLYKNRKNEVQPCFEICERNAKKKLKGTSKELRPTFLLHSHELIAGVHLNRKDLFNKTFEEIEISIRLENEGANVLRYLGENTSDNMVYFEWGGQNLLQLIQNRKKPLERSLLEKLVTDVLAQTKHMHKLGLVHADIKTDNIVYNRKRNCFYLMDFGMTHDPKVKTVRVGTELYSSPEVHWNKPQSCANDVHCLGVTFFECMNGVRPIGRIDNTDDWTNFWTGELHNLQTNQRRHFPSLNEKQIIEHHNAHFKKPNSYNSVYLWHEINYQPSDPATADSEDKLVNDMIHPYAQSRPTAEKAHKRALAIFGLNHKGGAR